MRYSLEPRDRLYVKGYGFMSFTRSMSNKYGKKPLDTAKKSTTDAIKTASKRAIQKTANIDNAKYIDIVMPMYNSIEYSDNYSKTSGSLWQYCKDIPAVDDDSDIVDFNRTNATDSFNFKTKITGQTAANNNNCNIAGRVNVEIMVPLKYRSNF